MHALSQGSANYAKGFLSPLSEGQTHDNFFDSRFQTKPVNYDRLMRPAWGTPEYQQFKDSGQTSFIGDNNMPDFNLGNFLGEFWGGKTTFGSNAPEHNTLGSKAPEHNTINYMGGKGAEDKVKTSPFGTPVVNNFSISGNNVNNTRANTALGNNQGLLGNGPKNSMGLNGENPTAGAGPWSDDSGSYGTGDGNTWHTDDYNWNGDGGDGGYEDSVVSSVHNPSGEYTETGDDDTGVDDDSDDDDGDE